MIEPLFLPGCLERQQRAEMKKKKKKKGEDDDDEEDVIMRVGTGVLSRRAVGSRINGRSVRVAGYSIWWLFEQLVAALMFGIGGRVDEAVVFRAGVVAVRMLWDITSMRDVPAISLFGPSHSLPPRPPSHTPPHIPLLNNTSPPPSTVCPAALALTTPAFCNSKTKLKIIPSQPLAARMSTVTGRYSVCWVMVEL